MNWWNFDPPGACDVVAATSSNARQRGLGCTHERDTT